MSAPRPLNDDEVQQEMKKMRAFIKQEAVEKAREIQVKADEEFNIEKAKLVRQETVNIESLYERKKKQAEISRKIAQSTHLNKARLKILQNRDALLDELFTEARSQLKHLTDDKPKYQEMLNNLVLQCFYQLMELEVHIRCRQEDEGLVQEAIQYAAEKYNEIFHKQVNAVIDKNSYLKDVSGGIVATTQHGRILCSNTFESRLEMLQDQPQDVTRYSYFALWATFK